MMINRGKGTWRILKGCIVDVEDIRRRCLLNDGWKGSPVKRLL